MNKYIPSSFSNPNPDFKIFSKEAIPKLPDIIKLHTRNTNVTKFLLKNIRPYETPVKKFVLRSRKEPTTRKPPRLPS